MRTRKMNGPPPLDRVREALDYDPETGIFTWKITLRNGSIKPGDVAGKVTKDKIRRTLWLDGQSYYCSRVAWHYVHGVWPAEFIDHINGDTLDDRIVNLREATWDENARNTKKPKHNRSGFKGVHWRANRQRWVAAVRVNGKLVRAGSFKTAEEAAEAYKRAAIKHHGEFACFDR